MSLPMTKDDLMFTLKIIILIFYAQASCQSSFDPCSSFEQLERNAERLRQSDLEISCYVPSTCLELSCDIKNNQFYGAYVFMFFPCSNPLTYKLTGHGFESSAAINQTYFLQGSNKYSIDLQGSGSVKQLVVESAMIDADSSFSLKMEMVLRNNTEITLIPESRLTLPPCLRPLPSKASYGTTTASNAFNTDQDQIVRVNTTRACSQSLFGTCRNNEICITNDIILNNNNSNNNHNNHNNNSKAAFCYCFDNFQLDGQYSCTEPVPPKKNRISIPAIVCGAVATTIILVVVVALVAKHVIKRRGPRDLGFNPLNDSSVVLEDPPMINV